MTAPVPEGASPWYDEGHRAGGALDSVSSVLVAGRDGEAAAWVALGLAQAQAERRRVAVADLVGDAQALAALVGSEDGPGIADSLIYGVSLNKVARAVDDTGQMFVLPSGAEPVAAESIFRNDRWRRLASGFREVGALLVLAARADTPGIEALAASVDGVVIAGDLGGALPEIAPPLAVVALPSVVRRGRFGRPSLTPARSASPADTPDRPLTPAASAPAYAAAPDSQAPDVEAANARATPVASGNEMTLLTPEVAPVPRGRMGSTRGRAIAFGIAALTAVAAGLLWLVPHPLDNGVRRAPVAAAGARAPRPAPLANIASASAPNAGAAGLLTPGAAAVASDSGLQRLTVSNPADSAAAAMYAVYVVSSNTPDGASVDWRIDRTPPVLALTPVLQDGAPFYRLVVGAYRTRAQADSLLRDLQRRGVLAEGSGDVVRAPYALLIEARVPAAEAARRVQALAARGIPTYPLSRGDGTVALYAGAFQTAAEAAYLARMARAAGVPTTLVYRTGSAR